MSSDDQLAELLRTAARVGGPERGLEPRILISRARRNRRRMVGFCAAAVAVILLSAVTVPSLLGRRNDTVDVAAGSSDGLFPLGWSRLPDAPLSPRSRASAATIGDEVVVAGGVTGDCQVTAGCPPPRPGSNSAAADGAAFNLTTRTWRSIAPAPVPIASGLPPVVLDGEMYLAAPCPDSPTCPATLLRYRPKDDAWDVLPAAPAPVGPFLAASATGLVVGAASDERTYWRLNVAAGTWAALPEDPLPPSLLNARIVAADGDLLLFGRDFRSGGPREGPVVGARLDDATGAWTELPSAFGANERVWPLEGLAVLSPSPVFTQGGGILDVAAGVWKPLPPSPPEADAQDAMVGALGATSSFFEGTTGWVLDVTSGTWMRLPAIDERPTDVTVTAVGRRLFATGSRLVVDPQGQQVTGAWVWTPPPARAAPAPPAPAPAVAVRTTAPPATGAPTPAAPATQPTVGAPQFVSATGDAAAGRLTIRFDRPVVVGSDDNGPNPGNAPKSVLTAMSLTVYGSDDRCSGPQGNAHEYLAGVGTDTITTDATSMAAGTTYIAIAGGFVKSAADGTPNDAVQVPNGVPTGMFAGMSCIPVRVSGTVPTTPPVTDAVGGPELLSATGDGAAGRVTLRFSKPVVIGVGAGAAGRGPAGSTVPPSDSMAAMQLVVHTTDSSCSSPNGNAQRFLAGVGTDTITVEATSLVVGTTYISISAGFVKAADDGKWLRSVQCLALTVAG